MKIFNISFDNIKFLEESLQGFEPLMTMQPAAEPEDAYRLWGHLEANIYPEGIKQRGHCPTLDPFRGSRLAAIYSGPIGFEFVPFCSHEIQKWLIEKIEPLSGHYLIPREEKIALYTSLSEAEGFETFLHTRYVGQKRFSLEGAETLIPMLATILDKTEQNQIVIGMPHRGRLNVMANILKKSYQSIFAEFEDLQLDIEGSGDVKYHKGYSSEVQTVSGKKKKVWLAANPSHLESIDPVVEGIARATKSLPILVHGDAAISGQGVVYETLQLARLRGYTTGGTIHVVINNHIGFTTMPEDSRSTYYCTDIAKAFGAPVFHVNAENPESCIWAIECAYEVREKFGSDVFIDLNCFRKFGHNESDEPAFTQPLVYQTIRKKSSIAALYRQALAKEQIEVAKEDEAFQARLHEAHQVSKMYRPEMKAVEEHGAVDAKLEEGDLKRLAVALSTVPEGFELHPRLRQMLAERLKAIQERFLEVKVDWAFAESLSLASLLAVGKRVRMAGQDSRRGTFSQRHGMWVDQKSEERYFPHSAIARDKFELIDSPLSEFAALGFELGFSLGDPEACVLWEAQFGDFCNGAQVIIDQYLASGEQKWGQRSTLTLLLPHGYEGQGPEHSSARIERFLSLCADDNLIVCNPTTPAQVFHLLRRQWLKKEIRKPLILFTPKGLLRLPAAFSSMQELYLGSFEEVLDDLPQYKSAKRLLFCQGRIYYDLIAARKESSNTAIIRIEQLYPLDSQKIKETISSYNAVEEFFWVQEEPANMGAWLFLREQLELVLPKNQRLKYRGRSACSSPAVGSHLVHNNEQAEILKGLL